MPPEAAQALVAAAGTAPLDLPITVIGTVAAGAGLVAEAPDGGRSPLEPRGYVHAFDS
jgi:hypothetical protein